MQRHPRRAIEFCGTEGRLWISRARCEYYEKAAAASATAAPPPTVEQASGNLDRDHMQNFVDCVRSRTLPNGDVLIGHRSAQASHLDNLAYLQKRRIAFDPVREQMLTSRSAELPAPSLIQVRTGISGRRATAPS